MASPRSAISPSSATTPLPESVLTHVYPVCVGGGKPGKTAEVGRGVGQPLLGTPAASDPLTTALRGAPGRYRHILALEERGYP